MQNLFKVGGIRLLAAFAVLLAGCSGPPDAIIGVAPDETVTRSGSGLHEHEIFVMTTRAPDQDPGILYSGNRGTTTAYAEMRVTIPPTHESGKLERPKKLPPDPNTDFVIGTPTVFKSDTAFLASVNRALAQKAPKDRTVLLFVHGFNTKLPDAVLRLSQFVEDSEFTGVPVLFSWASRGKLLDYVYDLNSALAARDSLVEGSRLLGRSNARSFDILAHSMGNMLTVEAMRQTQLQGKFGSTGRLDTIILASADIDLDVFRKQMSVFPKSERTFYILVTDDDKALATSKRIAGGVSRVGDTEADVLEKLGVTVIDLSEVKDAGGGLNHDKFAGSPEVVQLIGNHLLEDHTLQTSSGHAGLASALSGTVFAVGATAASAVSQ